MALAVAALLAVVIAAGCGGGQAASDEREAGRVFDRVFTEQEVIDYLDAFRAGNGTADDADWAQWMADHGATAESLRKEVVQYLAQNYLVERAAGLCGAEVSDDEVAAAIQKQKDQYPSEMAWTRALINAGYTEDAYALSVKSDLLKQKIKDAFADPAEVSDEDLEDYANNRMTGMTTRRSSAVFVSIEEAGGNMAAKARAQQAKAALDAGEDFDKVFAEYSSTAYSEDGDMGYDYYEVPSLAYNKALNAMHEVGEVSDVVESDEGYFVITLTDVFSDRYVGRIKLKKFPPELLEQFRAELAREQADEEYNEFYTRNVSEAQVAVEPMPDGLPYDV